MKTDRVVAPQAENGLSEATTFPDVRLRVVRNTKLLVVSTVVVFLSIFFLGATSWARFSNEVGGPVGLFTQTDYAAIAIGSRIVSGGEGARLYDLAYQLEGQQALRTEGYLSLGPAENAELKYAYPYTPFIAVLWSPFSAQSPLTSMALWDLLNLAAFVGGLLLLVYALPIPNVTRLLILLGALTSFPMIVNLEQGQSSGLVMFGFAGGIALLKRGKDLPAGLVLGLLLVKVQWLPLILLVLIFKRRWRTLVGLCATGLLLLAVTFATIGTAWIPDYLVILQKAQASSQELLLDPWYSHSLTGGLTALIGRGATGFVLAANDVALLLLAIFLLILWRGKWQPATDRWDGAMAVTMLAAIFTNPQLNTHDLTLLALPAALGISYLQSRLDAASAALRIAFYALLWAIYLSTALFLSQVFNLQLRVTSLAIFLMLAILSYALISTRRAPEAVPAASV